MALASRRLAACRRCMPPVFRGLLPCFLPCGEAHGNGCRAGNTARMIGSLQSAVSAAVSSGATQDRKNSQDKANDSGYLRPVATQAGQRQTPRVCRGITSERQPCVNQGVQDREVCRRWHASGPSLRLLAMSFALLLVM